MQTERYKAQPDRQERRRSGSRTERVGKEDRVIEERLRHHQRESHQAAPAILNEQHPRNFGQRWAVPSP